MIKNPNPNQKSRRLNQTKKNKQKPIYKSDSEDSKSLSESSEDEKVKNQKKQK